LLRGPVLMLKCPLLALLVVDRGQHGHPDWSAPYATIYINIYIYIKMQQVIFETMYKP